MKTSPLAVSVSSPAFLFQQNVATQKLRKAWRELETQQLRILRDIRVERNRLKGAYCTPSVRRILQMTDTDDTEGSPFANCSAGFCFKANGDLKRSIKSLRRDRLNNSITVHKNRHSTLTSAYGVDSNTSVCQPTTLADDTEGSFAGDEIVAPPQSVKSSKILRSRHSVGNLSGFKVGPQRTRHMSSFNISPNNNENRANFLDPTPSFTVRQVQRQLGLHKRMPDSAQGGGVDVSSKEVEQLERAITVLQMTMSHPVADTSLLESYGEKAEEGAATPRRRRCEACQLVLRSSESIPVRETVHYNKPRWQIAPSGRLVPSPLKSMSIPFLKFQRKNSTTTFLNRPRGDSLTSIKSIPSRSVPSLSVLNKLSSSELSSNELLNLILDSAPSLPMTDNCSTISNQSSRKKPAGNFNDAVVSKLGGFHAVLPEVMPALFPELRKRPRHIIATKYSMNMLRTRNSEETDALKPKVDNFVKSIRRFPQIHTAETRLETTAAASHNAIMALVC